MLIGAHPTSRRKHIITTESLDEDATLLVGMDYYPSLLSTTREQIEGLYRYRQLLCSNTRVARMVLEREGVGFEFHPLLAGSRSLGNLFLYQKLVRNFSRNNPEYPNEIELNNRQLGEIATGLAIKIENDWPLPSIEVAQDVAQVIRSHEEQTTALSAV